MRTTLLPIRPAIPVRLLAVAVALAAAAGCSSLAPDASGVKLTRDAKDVVGCKEIDRVESFLSLSFEDARTQIRNQAAAKGANVVLVTSSFGDSVGTAYICPAPAK